MKNNKFKNFLLLGTAAITISLGANALFNNAVELVEPTTPSVKAEMVVEQQDSYAVKHELAFTTPGANGEIQDIHHNGKIIGNIQKFADKMVVRTNLNKTELGEIYNELQAAGELSNVRIGPIVEPVLDYARETGASQSRINEIIGGGLSYKAASAYKSSDIEKFIVGASKGFDNANQLVSKLPSKIEALRIKSNSHLQSGPRYTSTPG